MVERNRTGPVVLGLLMLGTQALAQEPADESPEDDTASEDDAAYEVIVRAEWETPGSVSVIDVAQLSRFERDDIGAVLGEVPGVTVREEDGFGLRPNIGVRGVSSDRSSKITLLEDGVLLAPAPYAAPAAYYFPMVTRMTGVEVSKGPASIQNGPSTVGGALNLVSRAVPEGPVAFVDLAGGLRRTGRLHAYAGTQGRHFGALVEGVGLRTDGFKQLDGGGPTGFDRGEAVLKARWHSSAEGARRQAVEVKLGYSSERSHETYLGLSVDDFADTPYRRYAGSQNDLMGWQRWLAEIRVPVHIDDIRLETVAYHHDLKRVWTRFSRFDSTLDVHGLLSEPATSESEGILAILRGDADSATPEETLLIGTNDRRYRSSGVQSRLTVRSTPGGATSHFEAGLRLHADQIDRLQTEDPFQMRSGTLVPDDEPTRTVVDGVARARAIAAYVHEDLIVGGLHLVPGLRVESIWTRREDADNNAWTHRLVALPGLGLLYDLSSTTAVFAGVHRGFSPVPPGEPVEARPETSWNVEAGLRWRGPWSSVSAVGYFNDYANLTGQCTFSSGCTGQGLDRQFNAGRVWSYGAELEAEHTVALAPELELPLRASYTFTEATFRSAFVSAFPQFGSVAAGDFLPYLARHQASAQVGVRHRRFDVAVSVRTRSPMLDAAGPFEDPLVPALTVLDAAANVQVTQALTVYATGSNLTGTSPIVSMRPLGARPPAPLQVMVGIKAQAGGRER